MRLPSTMGTDTPSPLEGGGLLDITTGVACLRGDPRGLAVVEPVADPDNRSNARPGACLPDYSLPRSEAGRDGDT